MKRSFQTPTVLHPVTLPDFLQYIIDRHVPPTLLIICASQEDFLLQLLQSINSVRHDAHDENLAEQGEQDGGHIQAEERNPPVHPFLIPTLSLIASSQSIKVAFCPSLNVLRAYLSTLTSTPLPSHSDHRQISSAQGPRNNKDRAPRLALLNPISLHRETAEFSAQGISKTFAAAVEAAHRSGQHLIIAECSEPKQVETYEDVDDPSERVGDLEAREEAPAPWEEEISILNVTTKSFGAGERGWVGRTVKIRRVAERWCRFQDPKEHEHE